MNKQLQTNRKTKLSMALALALGVGMSFTAQAVQLDNNDKLGDAGIFQYYTANGGWQTFIRLINTSDQALSVKLSFREASNSREVFDFILFLSPYDVWSGWTDATAANGNVGLRTRDTSCVYPLPENNTTGEGWKRPDLTDPTLLTAEFQTRAFTGIYDDGGNAHHTPEQRLSEGHVEVIGIASHGPGDFFNAVKHGGLGTPADCAAAAGFYRDSLDSLGNYVNTTNDFDMPNVLGMNGYLINVDLGQGGGFDPDIMTDFASSSLVVDSLLTATDPDLDSATPSGGPDTPRDKQKGRLMDDFPGPQPVVGGVDDVSALFQRTAMMNEWAASSNPQALVSDYYTQWVVTFPTKHYYVDLQNDLGPWTDEVSPTLRDPNPPAPDPFATSPTSIGLNDAVAPFWQEFDDGYVRNRATGAWEWDASTVGMACEPYYMRIWNREERMSDFHSPSPDFPVELCNEVNVLVFNDFYLDKGLISNYSVTFPDELLPTDVGGDTSERGWAAMDFWANGRTNIPSEIESIRNVRGLWGLPVTGWLFSVFNTDGPDKNHTAINSHKYTRIVD